MIDAVCGGANLGLGVAHLQAVLARSMTGQGLGGAARFTYDFHFVGLVLVGLLLIVPGALCLMHAIPGSAAGVPPRGAEPCGPRWSSP